MSEFFTFRLSAELRGLLVAATRLSGRSLGEEIVARLEASFAKDQLNDIPIAYPIS